MIYLIAAVPPPHNIKGRAIHNKVLYNVSEYGRNETFPIKKNNIKAMQEQAIAIPQNNPTIPSAEASPKIINKPILTQIKINPINKITSFSKPNEHMPTPTNNMMIHVNITPNIIFSRKSFIIFSPTIN
jgi:hypothetical protein